MVNRLCACLPSWEFTKPPAVAAIPPRSNPLSFWIRAASIPVPGAAAHGKQFPARKRSRNFRVPSRIPDYRLHAEADGRDGHGRIAENFCFYGRKIVEGKMDANGWTEI